MNPEAIEAAAKALRDKYAAEVTELPVESFINDATAALEAAAPYLIREEALKQMRSIPWFEDMVMAEAVAFHSGGNCRYVREARAAELEAAAEAAEGMHDPVAPDCLEWADWLRARAAAIRAGEA